MKWLFDQLGYTAGVIWLTLFTYISASIGMEILWIIRALRVIIEEKGARCRDNHK